MPRFTYSQAMLQFIERGFKKMGVPELTDVFNQEFGLNKTPKTIKSVIQNYKFTCGRSSGELRKGTSIYSKEQIAWIKNHYKDISRLELTDKFNARFGAHCSPIQLAGVIKRHNIKSGRTGRFEKGKTPWNQGMKYHAGGRSTETQFKKGHKTHNWRPIGSERVSVDGYIEIKIENPNTWRLKHRVVYEQTYGKLTSNDVINFIDKNPLNCELSNLEKVSRREHMAFNQSRLRKQPPELQPTIRLICKLNVKTRELNNDRI